MHFISEELESYIILHSKEEPNLLKELNKETHLKVLQPRMLSGHYQGRILSLISKIVSPQRILEIGTYTGYSAICLAEGLADNGELHTIDINEELHDLQRKYFEKSGFGKQIIQHTGNALKIIPELNMKFDLVFIDADKQNYSNYFDLVIDKMNSGGLILSDNVLWSGKVLDIVKPNDKSTASITEYNKKLKDDPRIETVILPVRDGLTVSRVKRK